MSRWRTGSTSTARALGNRRVCGSAAGRVVRAVGEVEPTDARAVLAGLAPGTGLTPNGTTPRAHPRRVPGFDLAFSVPKSVSVAQALADRRVQRLIVTACEAALAETLGWLEREACFVRRGTNHRDTGCSMGDTSDGGAWIRRRCVSDRTSLDGRAIYDAARTGGAVFQAATRRELTAARFLQCAVDARGSIGGGGRESNPPDGDRPSQPL